MIGDLPPKLWLPPKPAIVRAASLELTKLAIPIMGTFAAASVNALRAKATTTTTYVPTDFANLEGWWRADLGVTDAGSGAVSAWADQSGNGRNVTQGTPSNRPTVYTSGGPNNQAYINFDGSNDKLAVTFSAISQPLHFFAVFKLDSYGTTEGIVSGSTSSQRLFYIVSTGDMMVYFGTSPSSELNFTDTNNWYVWEAYANSWFGTYLKYGTTSHSQNTCGTGALDGITIGQLPSYSYFDGQLAEVFFYSEAKTGTDLTNIRNYLGDRYSLTV